MPLEYAGATDVGRKRDHNEDAYLILPDHNLAVVCDGMGGHEAGEVASNLAVETVGRFFELAKDAKATWPFRYDKGLDESSNRLAVSALWANQRIREQGELDAGRQRGMGTTFVGVLVVGSRATFGWVGDSRGYLWRKGELHAATSDHSLINELIKTGRLSDDEIANFQHKNIITRALGMADFIEVDLTAFDLEPGDVCVVCCDGLTGMLTDERIAEVLSEEQDLKKACDRLVAESNANGGLDNITVALIRYTPDAPAAAATPPTEAAAPAAPTDAPVAAATPATAPAGPLPTDTVPDFKLPVAAAHERVEEKVQENSSGETATAASSPAEATPAVAAAPGGPAK
jgi:protein phosphatase